MYKRNRKTFFMKRNFILLWLIYQIWNYMIKLKLNKKLTFGPIYAFFKKELEILQKYLKKYLKKRFI